MGKKLKTKARAKRANKLKTKINKWEHRN